MPSLCDTPPDFTLPIFHSTESFTLSSGDGKVILLSFMNIACSHCWTWFPRWMSLKTDYDLPNVEIVVVMFNSDPDDITDTMIESALTAHGLGEPNFTLLRDSGDWGAVATPYRSGFGSSPYFPYAYLISRSHLIANMWHRNSTSGGELVSFDSMDDDDVETFIRHRIDDLLIDRPRWNTILTLDFSDSMNSYATLAGTTKSKIAFLRDAVDVCLRVWKDYALCEDKLGVVRFGSSASSDGALLAILPGANVEAISDAIAAATASGCTAMGAGIATGIDILETDPMTAADPHRRHMIVFTDGIQNRNPMVWQTADCGGGVCVWEPQIRHVDPADISLMGGFLCNTSVDGGESGYAGVLPRIISGNPMQTAVHTIAIGAPDSYHGLLAMISSETSGVSYLDTDIWPNLEEFFVESVVEVFRGFTLGIVAKASGTLAGPTAEHELTFRLNRSVRNVTIILSWVDETAPLTFELRKDGDRLSLQNKQSLQPAASVTTIPFPLYQPPQSLIAGGRLVLQRLARSFGQTMPSAAMLRIGGQLVEAEGEYTLTIRHMFPGTTQRTPFHLMVLADDKNVEVDLRMPKQVFFTDERIPLQVVATEHGQPVEHVISVTAAVNRPTVSFGNLYADQYRKTAGKVNPKDTDVLAGRYQTVVKNMLQNAKVIQQLRKRTTQAVRLEPEVRSGVKAGRRGGVYLAQYPGTRIPGHYRIEARVRGATATAGVFERLVNKTVLVLPRPDLKRSKIQVSSRTKAQNLVLTMTPADRHGNLMGPGFGPQMQFLLNDKPCGRIQDNQDGSYQLSVDLPKPIQRSMKAALWIAGEKVFSGPLAALMESPKK
jgi:hypothetical protein